MTKIIPVANFGRRMVEHGRIRLGVYDGKRPKSIETFRFTSPDKTAIEQLAEQYGGTPRPWNNAKASPSRQFEVISDATDIAVWVLPGGLSTNYELWSGGGCVRRCDGVLCETSQQTYDSDYEQVLVDCICDAKGRLECKPTTRLALIIPSIRFGGSWRMETHGWNAAEELPGMADMIANLQEGGVLRGRLRLEGRSSQGGRRKYVVPALAIDVSADEMLAGAANIKAELNTGSAQALGSGASAPQMSQPAELPSSAPADPPPWAADDEIADAEIIEELDVYSLPHAPRDQTELTAEQIAGLRNGSAKWSAKTEGRVVRA